MKAQPKDKFLGDIVDFFIMRGTDLVLILDRDCSKEIKHGENVKIVPLSGEPITGVLRDGLNDAGSTYGKSLPKKVSCLRVADSAFSPDIKLEKGKVYRVAR